MKLGVCRNKLFFFVASKLYSITTCTVDIEDFENGFYTFPCGDGCGYDLTVEEAESIREFIDERNSTT